MKPVDHNGMMGPSGFSLPLTVITLAFFLICLVGFVIFCAPAFFWDHSGLSPGNHNNLNNRPGNRGNEADGDSELRATEETCLLQISDSDKGQDYVRENNIYCVNVTEGDGVNIGDRAEKDVHFINV